VEVEEAVLLCRSLEPDRRPAGYRSAESGDSEWPATKVQKLWSPIEGINILPLEITQKNDEEVVTENNHIENLRMSEWKMLNPV
jgi:hypothetical protein